MYATGRQPGSKGRKGRSLATCKAKKHCNPRTEALAKGDSQRGGGVMIVSRADK